MVDGNLQDDLKLNEIDPTSFSLEEEKQYLPSRSDLASMNVGMTEKTTLTGQLLKILPSRILPARKYFKTLLGHYTPGGVWGH